MRLIDLDNVLPEIVTIQTMDYDNNRKMGLVLMSLTKEPVVDAAEVVRCKDCKHWAFTIDNIGDCQNPRFAMPDTVDPTMYANEFCALGERRTK